MSWLILMLATSLVANLLQHLHIRSLWETITMRKEWDDYEFNEQFKKQVKKELNQ